MHLSLPQSQGHEEHSSTLHIRTSHVTYKSVMSLTHLCLTCTSVCHSYKTVEDTAVLCKYKPVISHMNESCLICISVCRSHSAINESCHTWISYVSLALQFAAATMPQTSHVTHGWVMSHMHPSLLQQRCHKRAMSHLNKSSLTCTPVCCSHDATHESCHTLMSHVTRKRVKSHVHLSLPQPRCHKRHSFNLKIRVIWPHHKRFCVTWLLHTYNDSFICTMTHSNVTQPQSQDPSHMTAPKTVIMWHDFYINTQMFLCDMTPSYVPWLIYMWHDLFICDPSHMAAPQTV